MTIPWPRSGVSSGTVSCVADSDARFAVEALRWYATANRLADIPSSALTINLVGHDASGLGSYLGARGVTVRAISAFDPRSPHCNKIAAALRLSSDPVAGSCVLTDTDVALFADPRAIALPAGAVGMRPVDLPNPPIRRLRRIFAKAGVPVPPVVTTAWRRGRTLAGNGNGGLYIIPAHLLPVVAGAWSRWALWLLDRRELMGKRWGMHVDQVAMALALSAEQIDVFDVGAQWNVPIHIGKVPAHLPEPAMLHYHASVDTTGQIMPTRVGSVDKLIARANRVTADVLREHAAPVETERALNGEHRMSPGKEQTP